MQKYFWTIILTVFCFAACNDDSDRYSFDPAAPLAFSADTLSFDTLLTAVNSPVKTFRVYNRSKNSLLISTISLAQGNASPFKINVDGMAGKIFENIEIRGGDSIYVFVDINPADHDRTDLYTISDRIVFITEGVSQQVVLQACGQDVFHYDKIIFTADTTISSAKPYLIADSLVVAAGATLTVPAGAVFYMHNSALIIIHGTVKIVGTVDNPVVFRGSRTDKLDLANPIPYDLIPGQWGGIVFTEESYDNELENVRIRNSNVGLYFYLADANLQKASIKNTTVTNVSTYPLYALNCSIKAENCEFSNSSGECLFLAGGNYDFKHCTVANYYPAYIEQGWKQSANKTLLLANAIDIEEEDGSATRILMPLKANFANTIFASSKNESGITVYRQNEVPEADCPLSYHLLNCLLMDEEFEDDNLVNCIYNVKPDSIFIDCVASDADGKDFAFDFNLKENSPAIGKADITEANSVPLDINGKNRLADGEPDIGAYEYEDLKLLQKGNFQ